MKNKTSVWVAGAAVVALVIFAAAYFLLIGPVMDSTAETDEQRTQVETQNQSLRSQNATLRNQFENIDQLREQLEVLQVQVPDAAEWDTFTTLVGDLANDNGAIITKITAEPAVAVAAETAMAAPDETSETSDAAASETAPDGAAGVATATGQAIPVTITLQGSPVAAIGTVNGLQAVDQRLFLAQAIDIHGLKASEGATPPVAPGDVSLEVKGYILVQTPVAPVSDQVPPTPWNNYAPFLSPA